MLLFAIHDDGLDQHDLFLPASIGARENKTIY